MPPRVVSCLLAGWLALAPALAAGYERKQGPAVLRLEGGAEDEGVKARLSDELTLTLTVEGESPIRFERTDEALEQEQVKALQASGVWHGVEAKTARTRTPDGRERWRQTFRLDPLKPGAVKLKPAPLAFTEGPDRKPHRVTWQPVPLTITTEVPLADAKELREIIGPEELPPVRSWWLPWLVGLGALVVLAGLVVGGRELRRLLAAPPPPPAPHEWALAELDRVEKLALPAAGQAEHYHTLLSDVLRRYFELRFELPASKQTTAEFLEKIRALPELTEEQREPLREFLRRCDLAKFARAEPSAEECRATAALARGLIEQTAAKAPVPRQEEGPPASSGTGG